MNRPPSGITSVPRSRSSHSIASVGIPSSPSFQSTRHTIKVRGGAAGADATHNTGRPSVSQHHSRTPSTVDSVDSDWETTSSLSRKTGLATVGSVSDKKPGGARVLPGRPRIPGELRRGEVSGGTPERVTVCVRAKPPLPESPIYDFSTETNTISLNDEHPTNKKRGGAVKGREDELSYSVDHLHLPPTPTSDLFDRVVSPLVAATMDGYDGTVFAYGMTGSGKTYTMGGVPCDPGVVPRAIDQVFDGIDEMKDRVFVLRVSYLELYNEQLRDLLNPNSKLVPTIHEKEGRICLSNLEEVTVSNPDDVQTLIEKGQASRRVGKTDFNEHSSRSHTIFTVIIESRLIASAPLFPKAASSSSLTSSVALGDEFLHSSSSKAVSTLGSGSVRFSRLNLIDLAGSEKATTDGDRQKEGGFINKSLLVLANVIEKLTEAKTSGHIPYRDSKLTRLLQDSLSGHARIAVICTVSLEGIHAYEALATLKFARRVSKVVTKAQRGTVAGGNALLQVYESEIADLRSQLAALTATQTPPPKCLASRDLDDMSESEDELELEQERTRLADLKSEAVKTEEELQQLQLARTKLQSQITCLSNFMLTSENAPSAEGAPLVPGSRRRRISDIPDISLGVGLPSGMSSGSSRRHVSALGVGEEDGANNLGRGRRGERMMGLPMVGVSEESNGSLNAQSLEAELAEACALLKTKEDAYKTEVADQQALVVHLRSNIAELKDKLEKADLEQAALKEAQVSAASARSPEDEDVFAELQQQIKALRQQQDQDELALREEISASRKLNDSNTTLQSQMREQGLIADGLRSKLLSAHSDRKQDKADRSAREAKFQSEIDALEATHAAREAEHVAVLESLRADHVRELLDKDRRIQERDAKIVETAQAVSSDALLQEELTRSIEERDTLRTQLAKSIKENTALKAELAQAAAKQSTIEEQLTRSKEDSSALEVWSAADEERTATQTDLARLAEENAALQKQLANSAEKDATVQKQLVRVVDEKSELETQLERSLEQTGALEAQLAAALTAHATSSASDQVWIQELQRNAEAAQGEASEWQEQALALEEKLTAESQARLEAARGMMESMQAAEAKLLEGKDKIKQLQKQAEESTVVLAVAKQEHETEVARIKSELASSTARIEGLNRQIIASDQARSLSRNSPPSPRWGIPSSPSISEGLNLQHSGSLRETRRPLPTAALPYTASSRSEAVALEDKEEIVKLNKTIVVQQEAISRLRAKMDTWMQQMRRSNEIIAQLMGQPGSSVSNFTLASFPSSSSLVCLAAESPSPSASLPSTPLSASPIRLKAQSISPEQPVRRMRPVERVSTLADSSNYSATASPVPTTPVSKHVPTSTWVAGSPRPPPLPHAGHQRANSQARTARRITIERDLENLANASKVEQSKSRFDSPGPASKPSITAPPSLRKL